MKPHIILASASKYKQSLLQRLNIAFTVFEPNIDESAFVGEAVEDLVKRLSIEKANKIAVSYKSKWVIGCDQVAALGEQRLGKPGNQQSAYQQLKMCSGKEIKFITGVALVNIENNKSFYESSVVKVKFIKLTDAQITNYLRHDLPYDCAGSFKIESLGVALFEWVKSNDPTSLEGLPLVMLCKLLRQAGIDPLMPIEPR